MARRPPPAAAPPPGADPPARSPTAWSSRTARSCCPRRDGPIDPGLALRVAAAAAPASCRSAGHAGPARHASRPPCPTPWPDGGAARAGHPARRRPGRDRGLGGVRPARAGGAAGCRSGAGVRSLPQRNAVHRYTVDRHLVEAAARRRARTPAGWAAPTCSCSARCCTTSARACPATTRSSGADIADRSAARWGLSDADRAIIVRLVRHHLLLPDTATRRDLDDPATLTAVAARRRPRPEILDLLHALTEADARRPARRRGVRWKARLVADLVRRVHALLGERRARRPCARWPSWRCRQRASARSRSSATRSRSSPTRRRRAAQRRRRVCWRCTGSTSTPPTAADLDGTARRGCPAGRAEVRRHCRSGAAHAPTCAVRSAGDCTSARAGPAGGSRRGRRARRRRVRLAARRRHRRHRARAARRRPPWPAAPRRRRRWSGEGAASGPPG